MACESTSLADTVEVSEELPSVVPQISSADLPYAMTTRNNPPSAPLSATSFDNEASYSKATEITSIDSGYASLFSTSGSHNETAEASQKSATGLGKYIQRKITRLKLFDKVVPVAAQDRFEDLNELIGESLYDYLKKSGITFSAISIKLKVLGESECAAKPSIVVLCDKAAVKRVKRFFSLSWVKSECQPCQTDPCRPSFEVFVYGRPPKPMSATSPASIYVDWASKCLTLCGSMIGVNMDSNIRIATLGGVLSVTMAGGNTELYCMTVSHVIAGDQPEEDTNKLEETGREEVNREAEEDVGEEDSDIAMEADLFACEEEEYTLDLGSEGDRDSCAFGVVNQNPSTGDSSRSQLKIGCVTITSYDALEDGINLDWALFKIDDPSLYCPNILLIPGDSDQSHILREPKALSDDRYTAAPSVFLLSGTRGVIRGRLSFTLSSLMLAPGRRFTDTYTLRLSHGLDLNSGDCGSWVVDSHTYEVYGHVVALDAFGEAYVIPIKETLRCIEKQLSAQRVCLPRQDEVQEWIRQSQVEQVSDVLADSSIHPLKSTSGGEQIGEPDGETTLQFSMRPDATISETEHPMERVSRTWQEPEPETSGFLPMAQAGPIELAQPIEVASSSTDRHKYPACELCTTFPSRSFNPESQGPPIEVNGTPTPKDSRWKNRFASARKAIKRIFRLKRNRETKSGWPEDFPFPGDVSTAAIHEEPIIAIPAEPMSTTEFRQIICNDREIYGEGNVDSGYSSLQLRGPLSVGEVDTVNFSPLRSAQGS